MPAGHHQQVIGHGIAVGRAAGQIPEQQDIFGIEIAVSQALDDPGGFGGIVKAFGGLSRFGDYALCSVFLHGVLIRFHVVKYYGFDNSEAVLIAGFRQ